MNTKSNTLILAYAIGVICATSHARADFTFGQPANLGPAINSTARDLSCCVSYDGLELYFGSDRGGGRGGLDLWVSARPTQEDDWGPPRNLGSLVNSASQELSPSISADGLELYFHANYRSGGLGEGDIWVTRRTAKNEPWTKPENLGSPVNSGGWEYNPCISSDGLALYLAWDGWVAVTRRATKDHPWEAPVHLTEVVNSWVSQDTPWISSDDLLLVFTDNAPYPPRPGGFGGTDVWFTRRSVKDGDWEQPVNLGPAVNTAYREDWSMISADGSTLYFTSDRPGGYGGLDLWQAAIIPDVDFDDDGDVDCTEICIMTEFWGTGDSLCDIAPPPFGDGIVDVQDLLLLAEHLTAAVDPNIAAAPDPATASRLSFTFGEVSLNSTIPGIEAANYETVGCFSYDGLEVYFTSQRPGGYGDFDLWVLRRASIDEDWGAPENLGPGVNSATEDSLASISADGLTLYFESNRVGGDYDIYATTRATTEDTWGQAVNLGPIVNSPHLDAEPWISPDDLELYFESYRPGGYGLSDIYVTRRPTTNDPWGTPENLGPVINSPYREQFLSLSSDGLILFFGETKSSPWRPGGYGGADMWMTRRASLSEPWQTPVNLGPEINGPYNDNIPRVSPDGRIFYFGSNRGGTNNCYQASIIPNVDFDDDGDVDCTEICIMTEFWGTSDSLCDIAPPPFGDGIVDVQDLIVLAGHLFEETPPTE